MFQSVCEFFWVLLENVSILPFNKYGTLYTGLYYLSSLMITFHYLLDSFIFVEKPGISLILGSLNMIVSFSLTAFCDFSLSLTLVCLSFDFLSCMEYR